MKQHPMIFGSKSVEDILKGRKTQTRRVIVPQPDYVDFELLIKFCKYKLGDLIWVKESFAEMDEFLDGYKREPFTIIAYKDHTVINLPNKAEFDELDKLNWNWESKSIKWKSPMFMPKDAARIWLEITDVKVQRVCSVSKEDCIKEGIRIPVSADNKPLVEITGKYPAVDYLKDSNTSVDVEEKYLRAYFASHWDTLNAKRGYSWKSNPFVWVIEFKRIS